MLRPDHVAALDSFVQLHTSRLPMPSGEALVYMVPCAAQIPLNVKLIAYSCENIASSDHFDTEIPSVRWLMKQIQEADHYKTSLIGMYFEDGTVLAHTVKRNILQNRDDSDDDT